jgi:hypothetical protein
MFMKSWIIAVGIISFGVFAFIASNYFTVETEYDYGEPTAYIDGATPSSIEHWEMY